jgi:hypothetical protein
MASPAVKNGGWEGKEPKITDFHPSINPRAVFRPDWKTEFLPGGIVPHFLVEML